jgi:peptidoglycan/xylan/chitin deacetylase (PgdA/CDA1 family)
MLPSMLEHSNPGVIYRLPSEKRTLFITLDDGPSESTETILSVLRKHGVPATFFVVSDHLEPEAVRRILSDGHQLGHHMKTTRSTDGMSDIAFQKEFLDAEAAISAFATTRLFRPAGGSLPQSQAAFVRSRGYRTVLGTVYPFDHAIRSESVIVTLARCLAVNGGIIILHDTRTRGRTTAAALDRLIPAFEAKGYTFALLPQSEPG